MSRLTFVRWSWLAVPPVLLAALIAVPGPVSAQQPATPTAPPPATTPLDVDSVVPIAADFQPDIETVLKVENLPVPVKISYTLQGKTVFVLPVLGVVSGVERVRKGDATTKTKCAAADALLTDGDADPVALEFTVRNLSADQTILEAIRTEVLKSIAAANGQDVTKVKGEYRFAPPSVDAKSFRVSLFANGLGTQESPAEVPVSSEASLPVNGRVRLDLDRGSITRLAKAHGRPITLGDLHVHTTGKMKMKLEQLQFEGRVTMIRDAVDVLRKKVSSASGKSGSMADVLVAVPGGGEVTTSNGIQSALRASLSVTISVREGAANPSSEILSLMRDSLGGLVKHQELKQLSDEKQLAVLIGGQVTASATVGEIKKLAHMTNKEREDKLKTALDDYDARRRGEKTEVSGGVKLNMLELPIGPEAQGAFSGSSTESGETRRQRQLETLNKGLDHVNTAFEGMLQTLSGISFDDTSTRGSFDQMEQEFKKNTFLPVMAAHRWPDLPLTGGIDPAITPAVLAEQYRLTQHDLELARKAFGTADKLAKTRTDLDTLEKALERLKATEADLKADADKRVKAADERVVEALKRLSDVEAKWKADADKRVLDAETRVKNAEARAADAEKKLTTALATLDKSDAGQLRAKLDTLAQRVKASGFASSAADFDGDWRGSPPPALDCTAGVDDKTAKAAQAAWAKHYNLSTSGETFSVVGADFSLVYQSYAVVPKARYTRGGDTEEAKPARGVTVSKAFAMSTTEVTQGLWKAVMGKDNNPSKNVGDSLPVENVTHAQAVEFCGKLAKQIKKPVRLPTEAEWELACRGGAATAYSCGTTLSYLESNFANSNKQTLTVASAKANPFGLYDMHGNVWEWCEDWYDATYYSRGPGTDPVCTDGDKVLKVTRGGSYQSAATSCAAGFRNNTKPTDNAGNIGFRVVFTLD